MALPTLANHSDIISLVISLVKYEPFVYTKLTALRAILPDTLLGSCISANNT
jgi:hypothetical protein